MNNTPLYQPRMELLDAVRGFALIGLFLVHMQESYELYWSNPQEHPITQAVWGVFMGKSFSMLALCFGVSFFIIMDRSSQRGVDFTGRFIWRLAVLFFLGTVHTMVYRGDILQVLAVAGLILLPLDRIRSNYVLLGLAVVCLFLPWQTFQMIQAIQGAEWANKAPLMWTDPSMETMLKGDMWQVMQMNLTGGSRQRWLFFIESGRIWHMAALFIIGLLLGRIGFFQDPDKYRMGRRVWLVILCALWLGAPYLKTLAVYIPQAEGQFVPRGNFNAVLDGWRDLSQMGVMLLVFVELYQLFASKLLGLLSPVGRMTLTLYVLQSVVFVPLFYPFGADWYHTISPWQAFGIGLAATVAQIVVAHLWFKGFVYGPLEWVWRAATYLTVKVPFVRKA